MDKEIFKNEFRTSDSDLSAYLITLGYEPCNIEIKKDKRHGDRLKVFTHFDGTMEELVKIQKECEDNKINIDLKKFSIARQRINKIINIEIDKYNNTST